VILGSGHKTLAYDIDGPQIIIPYVEVPYFPIPTNVGHNRELVYGTVKGRKTIMFAGRIHLFEGYRSYYHAWLGTLSALLGCQLLICTNSCGAISTELKVGDFMIISDHMNCSSLPFFNGNYLVNKYCIAPLIDERFRLKDEHPTHVKKACFHHDKDLV
jgi:purine-nucleoside phosphorylase